MATFSSLEANLSIMKAGNSSYFETNPDTGVEFTDAQIKAKYKTEAKAIMQRDLIRDLKIDQENTTDLDETVDLNETELSEALAYLQLHLIYLDLDEGEGSQARYRSELFYKRYTEYRMKFGSINTRHLAESYNYTGSLTIG
jgi:hypothetical protein